jgi:Fe-S cluster assembly ATP-binding protein
MKALEIKGLKLSVGGRIVLDGLSMRIPAGEIHAIIGKNGIGKSSLAKAIAGCPGYEILSGDVAIDGTSVTGKSPDEIARLGFFLAFQNPIEIPGVSVANFIRAALQARLPKSTPFNAIQFYGELYEKMAALSMDKSFSSRALGEGFSGGEKKRCEILQMLMLRPKYAILDEIDSGLDVDALKIIADAINSMRCENFGAIVITHHSRILECVGPDMVHILSGGVVAMSGGMELVYELERRGYDFVEAETGQQPHCPVKKLAEIPNE